MACEGGVPMACYELGHLYEQGAGYGLTPGDGRRYFEKACALGMELSCRWVAAPW